jgi:hypothetical protein
LDDHRKQAYRWLLYQATLEIRLLCWTNRRWRDWFIPRRWTGFVRQARTAGTVADWLHNLAMFSALDFNGFDEDRFWEDYQCFVNEHPQAGLERFRAEFEIRARICSPRRHGGHREI